MQDKQKEVQTLIATQNEEIRKVESDIDSLNSKNTAYLSLTEELKSTNDRISDVAQRKNSIPNLLNQLMYIIPEEVQLTGISNPKDKDIAISARATEYDKLGYFLAKIKLDGILKDVISSGSTANGGYIEITIEGELP